MTKNLKPAVTDFFWGLAAPLLSSGEATEGALMGLSCLRVEGEFFTTCDHRTGELIVKLPATRVQELIDLGYGWAFAPAGRVFREWVLVPERDDWRWTELMAEARSFVRGG
jgi:hypothetical protein